MGLKRLADQFHTWSNSLIKDRFPLLSLYYYTVPRLYLYWRTQPIHRLLKQELKPRSDRPSILFFTVHKSASTLMVNFLNDLSELTGLIQIDYNGYFATRGQEGLQKQQDPAIIKKVFHKKGFIYGPLRNYVPVPEMADYPVILLLRDPRDVLTSQYYSIRNTHPLITPKLVERRLLAQSMSVDEHVKAQADRFVTTYTEYIDALLGKENVLFLKYENMVNDFAAFIRQIDRHCKLGLTAEQIAALDRTRTFSMEGEDRSSHKRKVTPGDHKEKLQPETIEWLNEKFGTVLMKLGYDL